MILKNGGQLENLGETKKLTEIDFKCENELVIQLWLNDRSLSYLTVEEAYKLKKELHKAIVQAINIQDNEF